MVQQEVIWEEYKHPSCLYSSQITSCCTMKLDKLVGSQHHISLLLSRTVWCCALYYSRVRLGEGQWEG